MSDFADVFSSGLVPPASSAYSSISIAADARLHWPFNYQGTSSILTSILDVSATSGLKLTLPPTSEVSTGESALVRNTGANAVAIHDANDVQLLVLNPGIAQFMWVTDNGVPGAWGQVTYGAGVSEVSAGDLQGLGTTAIGGTLAVSAPTLSSATSLSLAVEHRGQSLEFTGGASVLSLASAVVYGNDFYCFVKNSGSGVLTVTPSSGTVDGQSTLGMQPGESLILMCSGSVNWYSVGYGRSTLYQFSQLVLDVSAGGTFPLSTTQASNKMLTFVGNPATTVTIVVPGVVSVYYAANNLSVNQNISVKVLATPGVSISQSQRAVLLCDGSTVSSAQSATATTVLSMLDGSVTSPSLNFSSQPNTGFYKYSTQGLGIAVAGIAQLYSNGGGATFPLGFTSTGGNIATVGTWTHTGGGVITLNGTVVPPSKTLVVTTDIGTTVQAYDADTPTVSPGTAGNVLTSTGSAWTSSPNAAALPSPTGLAGASLVVSGSTPAWGSSIAASSPVATTSGTAIDFTSIPSWVKRITLTLRDISTNGTSNLWLQFGDAGGVETTGYSGFTKRLATSGVTTLTNPTAAVCIASGVTAATTISGSVVLTSMGGNNWLVDVGTQDSGDTTFISISTKATSAQLDRVRLTTLNGTDTFDGGEMRISWE